MRSTFSGLNTMVRGLYAQQTALDTVGHNISNASTEGYSRQRVNMATSMAVSISTGSGASQLGTGVSIQSITRARDTFVDRQYWQESSYLGYGQAAYDSLSKIEDIFCEPADTGVQSVLNEFWNSLQTLATDASNYSARVAVRERGVQLVDTVQHAAQQLKDLVGDINANLDVKVQSINQITEEIYALNKQISNIEIGGLDHANDLRDRRDLLVDQLSVLGNISVTEDRYSNYSIAVGGYMLVDGNNVNKLKTVSSVDPDYGYEVNNIVMEETNQPVSFTTGEIKGLIDSRDDEVAGAKGYLNNLAKVSEFLLKDFNDVHRTGYGLDNSTGVNFFGQGGEPSPDYGDAAVSGAFTAVDWLKELVVNDDFFADDGLDKIAAKTAATDGSAGGNNATNLANRLKYDIVAGGVLGGASLDSYYSSVIGALGVQTQNVERLAENQKTLLNQVTMWRESTAGINIDEELANMIKYQQGYNAAARVLTTMDEMIDKLINGTGVVGR